MPISFDCVGACGDAITAVDTSVLLDVFAADPAHLEPSRIALKLAIEEGTLVVCEVVAELRASFKS